MSQVLTLVTPPTIEPVTVAEAKAWMRLEIATDDATVADLISAAREVAETRTGRSFLATSWRWTVDAFPYGGGYFNRAIREAGPGVGWLPSTTLPMFLPRPNLLSVESIVYLNSNGSTTTLAPSEYVAKLGNPGRIAPAYGKQWPTVLNQIGAVSISFTSGYGTLAASVPVALRLAIKTMVGFYYENRETVGSISPGIEALLDSHDSGTYA